MIDLAVPVQIAIIAGFGLAYGWILHSAVERSVYKISGWSPLDSYALAWFLGLFAAFTPAMLYLAFGLSEFDETVDGVRLRQRLRRVAQFQVLCLCLYGLVVLVTVPQK